MTATQKKMALIIKDKRIRNVKLTGDEIEIIMEELERQPHTIYEFFNYDKIIGKLRKAKESKK